MSLALYRKYRPQTFGEIIGQNHIKVTIQNEIATGKIAHAYLFSGPRGLGKTTIARLIAKAVNCQQRKDGQAEPCNKCDACKEITEGRSIDALEIDAASHTGVDNVRENIIANARFTPTNRKYKVFIIDEVHMLSISAFNALLKTLEEPPAHAIFILATTELHKIPQTIISRCQHFDFRKVSESEIIVRLGDITKKEKKTIDDEVLVRIARWSEGSVRDAESLLGQLLTLDEKKITSKQADLIMPASQFGLVFELVGYLFKKDAASALVLVNKLVEDGVDLQKFTSDVVEVLRKLMLAKLSEQLEGYTVNLGSEWKNEIDSLMKIIQANQLAELIELFISAGKDLKSAEIVQLPLELAIVKACSQFDNTSISTKFPGPGAASNEQSDLTKPGKSVNNNQVKKNTDKIVKANTEDKKNTKTVTDIKLTLEQLLSKWPSVIDKLKDYNQSLSSTLKHHQPTAIKSDGVVEISFKYKFYEQRVKEAKNRGLIEELLLEIFQLPLRIETVIVKNLPLKHQQETAQSEQSSNLESIAQTFGGQLID